MTYATDALDFKVPSYYTAHKATAGFSCSDGSYDMISRDLYCTTNGNGVAIFDKDGAVSRLGSTDEVKIRWNSDLLDFGHAA